MTLQVFPPLFGDLLAFPLRQDGHTARSTFWFYRTSRTPRTPAGDEPALPPPIPPPPEKPNKHPPRAGQYQVTASSLLNSFLVKYSGVVFGHLEDQHKYHIVNSVLSSFYCCQPAKISWRPSFTEQIIVVLNGRAHLEQSWRRSRVTCVMQFGFQRVRYVDLSLFLLCRKAHCFGWYFL